MKKIICFLVFMQFYTLSVFSQKIDINSNGLYINSKKIVFTTTINSLDAILGKGDRVDVGLINNKSRRFYDKAGISFLITSNGNIEEMSIHFRLDKVSTRNIFKNSFLIYGSQITSSSKHTSISEVSFFKVLDLGEVKMYKASTPDFSLIFVYYGTSLTLQNISINF